MTDLKLQLNKIWAWIRGKYNALLPGTEHRIVFWSTLAVIFFFTAYLIALMDVGMKNGEFGIVGMVSYYLIETDNSFPFFGWLCTSLVIAVVICAVILHFKKPVQEERNFTMADSDVYGNARNISKEELQIVCEVETPNYTDRPIIGMDPYSTNKVLGAKQSAMDNGNVAIIGTPGSGKSFTICLPYIVQAIRRRESVVMTDTKGELWAKTVEFARANGYVIRRLDLRDPLKSNGMEFLKEMRHDTARTQVFVNTIVANCDISANYEGFAKNLLTACCLYVERNSDIPPEEKNLAKVYRMISLDADNLEASFKAVARREEMKPALAAYNSFKLASDSLRGNIVNNLASNMGILTSEEIQEMISHDEIDLSLPGKVPCIYYVSMSDQDDSTKFLSSLFFAFLFRNLVDYADSLPGQKLPVPCTILFEEFAQVKVPKIDKQLSTVRSRGCSIIMIMQTLQQLKRDYPNDWITMLDECPIQICLAANGEEVAKYFSEKCGECTIEARTDQHNIWSVLGTGRFSTGYGKRPFRNPNEIRKIPKYHCLIVWQRFDTLVTKTFGINKHPAYQYMTETSAFTKVTITDYAARAYIQNQENARVNAINEFIAQGGKPMWYVDVPEPEVRGPMNGKMPPVFASYSQLEDEAIAYSKAHPEQNEAYRRILEERRLNAAKKAAANAPKEPQDPKPPKPKGGKKGNSKNNPKTESQDPNQISIFNSQESTEGPQEQTNADTPSMPPAQELSDSIPNPSTGQNDPISDDSNTPNITFVPSSLSARKAKTQNTSPKAKTKSENTTTQPVTVPPTAENAEPQSSQQAEQSADAQTNPEKKQTPDTVQDKPPKTEKSGGNRGNGQRKGRNKQKGSQSASGPTSEQKDDPQSKPAENENQNAAAQSPLQDKLANQISQPTYKPEPEPSPASTPEPEPEPEPSPASASEPEAPQSQPELLSESIPTSGSNHLDSQQPDKDSASQGKPDQAKTGRKKKNSDNHTDGSASSPTKGKAKPKKNHQDNNTNQKANPPKDKKTDNQESPSPPVTSSIKTGIATDDDFL